VLAFTQFIVTIDYNIVYVALPNIGRELGFTLQSLQWVVSAYAVAIGGLLLFGGRAVDRLGQRRMFVLALVIYAVSSLVGGLATHPGVLVGARAAQGLGGALLTPATLTLIYTGFKEGPERNKAMGVWGAMGGAGLAAGALLGGVITNSLGWEWVFFVNVPLALGAAFAALRVLPADPPRQGRKSFDVPGALIATAGVTLIVLGLASGPEAGWRSARGAGSIIAGAVLLAILVLVEWRTRDPLVPLKLFGNRGLVTTMVVIFIFQGTLAAEYYVFTTYVQDVLHYTPLQAGLAFLPLTLVSMAVSLRLTAKVIGKLGVRMTLFVGTLITGAGMALLAVGSTTGASFWAILPGTLVWGIGGGIAFPTLFVAVATGVAPTQAGVASALASTSRQIGGAVGLAALVAVANAGLNVSPGAVRAVSDVAHGLRIAGYVAAIATIAGGLLALTLKRKPPAPAPAPAKEPEKVLQTDPAEV